MEQYLKERIEGNKAQIRVLQEENERYELEIKNKAGIKGIEKWIDYEFKSSASKTPEFSAFIRDIRKYIKGNLPDKAELINFSIGHFEVSGFIKRKNYVYFLIGDLRGGGWDKTILVRTAKNEEDFTGGSNDYTNLKEFKKKVNYLLKFDW